MKSCVTIAFCLALSLAITPLVAAPTVEVDVKGVDGKVLENVLLFLSIREQSEHPLLSEGRIRRLHARAEREIEQALKPFGYYRPSINRELSQPGPERWKAVYTISPGPPLRISSVELDVEGDADNDPEFRRLIDGFPLLVGDVLDQAAYTRAKSDFIKLAAERGYFEGTFVEHRISIDLETYQADINLRYRSGPRYDFGPVNLRQDVLSPELLRRYIPFAQGDPYSVQQVLDLQQALNDTQYFQEVEITLQQDQAIESPGSEIPVNVRLTPRKPHRYLFGIGYGTDTGTRAKIGWEMPRINRRGHRWESELKVAEIGSSLAARYRIPVFNPRTDELQFNSAITDEEIDGRESDIQTVGVSLSHARGRWREIVSLMFQKEDFRIAGVDGSSTLLIPGVSWSRIWARDRVAPRLGARVIFDFRAASDDVLSDASFFQHQSHLKMVLPAGARSRVIGRGTIGTTLVDEFVTLPTSVRFFAGGSNSVRGYSFNSLGPRDVAGNVIGGKQLLTGSLEFEQLIGARWGLAVFYDIGNAMDDFNDPLKKGAGFGFRWRSPVGPIAVDLAAALSEDGNPLRLHINIGPEL